MTMTKHPHSVTRELCVLGVCFALMACAGTPGNPLGSTDNPEQGKPTGQVAPPESTGQVQPTAEPALHAKCVELGLGTPEDCETALGMLLPEQLPKARGNALADSLPVAQLGFQIFYDPRFSTVRDIRCATCHLPEKSFGDGRPTPLGNDGQALPRNSPSIFGSAWVTGDFFWDGRADSLWSQPLFAFENSAEMASSRLAVAHTIATQPLYQSLYAEAFGPPPDLSDPVRFPASGKPGEPAFDTMTAEDQATVNRVFANVGKALEAYMRKVATGRAPFDAFLTGESELDQSARAGFATFMEVGCAGCHSGPTLSDGRFYNMNVPTVPGAAPDLGRKLAIEVLDANIFNARGPYADTTDAPPRPAVDSADTTAAFRTPTLRNVALTAPYGHNGYYSTLGALLAEHGPTRLSPEQVESITIFLLQLNGRYPDRPWSNWPTN